MEAAALRLVLGLKGEPFRALEEPGIRVAGADHPDPPRPPVGGSKGPERHACTLNGGYVPRQARPLTIVCLVVQEMNGEGKRRTDSQWVACGILDPAGADGPCMLIPV